MAKKPKLEDFLTAKEEKRLVHTQVALDPSLHAAFKAKLKKKKHKAQEVLEGYVKMYIETE